jgi:tetratricopeptide (TPR) repeat protein
MVKARPKITRSGSSLITLFAGIFKHSPYLGVPRGVTMIIARVFLITVLLTTGYLPVPITHAHRSGLPRTSLGLQDDSFGHLLLKHPEQIYPACVSDDYRRRYCLSGQAIAIADHLMRFPTTPLRAQLRAQLFEIALQNISTAQQFDWFIGEFVSEVRARAGGKIPALFIQRWQRYGDFVITDLDQDGSEDYLVTIHDQYSSPPLQGLLLWLHPANNTLVVETLPASLDDGYSPPAFIKLIHDIDGDQRLEILYTLAYCGASRCFERLQILAQGIVGWKKLLDQAAGSSDRTWAIKSPKGDTLEIIGTNDTSSISIVRYLGQLEVRSEYHSSSTIDSSAAGSILSQASSLARRGQFNQAIANLRILAEQPLQHPYSEWERQDIRAFVLFHLGIIYLLNGDIKANQRTWEKLVDRYPTSSIIPTVQTLREIARQPSPIFHVCSWLQHFPREWPEPTYPGDLGWTAGDVDCDPRLMLLTERWPTNEPIAAHAARLGLSWNALANDVDYNRDGRPDPIGIMVFPKARSAWIFLSHGNRYQPVSVAQPLSPNGSSEWYDLYVELTYQQPFTLVELTPNQPPAVLWFESTRLSVYTWNGQRFIGSSLYWIPEWERHYNRYITAYGVGEVRMQPSGIATLMLKITGLEANHIQYQTQIFEVAENELRRIAPSEQDPNQLVTHAIRALFRDDDPAMAHRLLIEHAANHECPSQYWCQPHNIAMVQYLRGLAAEYQGDLATARYAYGQTISIDPSSFWAALARRHGATTHYQRPMRYQWQQ